MFSTALLTLNAVLFLTAFSLAYATARDKQLTPWLGKTLCAGYVGLGIVCWAALLYL